MDIPNDCFPRCGVAGCEEASIMLAFGKKGRERGPFIFPMCEEHFSRVPAGHLEEILQAHFKRLTTAGLIANAIKAIEEQ